MVKNKRIYLNTKKTKYCIVKLFSSKIEMQDFYKKYDDKIGSQDKDHYKCLGVSIHYEVELRNVTSGKRKLSPETGIVLLNIQHCGAGIVCHELSHAVMYAYRHKRYMKRYPFIINNMNEEEKLLHNFTFATNQFYKWYWKVIGDFNKVRLN